MGVHSCSFLLSGFGRATYSLLAGRCVVFLAVLFAMCSSSCSTRSKPIPSLQEGELKFGKGFFAEEEKGDNSFRWMSEEGIVRIRNTRQDGVITLVGCIPEANKFTEAPAFTVSLNNKVLEEFKAPKGIFRKEYKISPSMQGDDDWSEMRITTNKSIIPKDIYPKATDVRQLGFKVKKMTWSAN